MITASSIHRSEWLLLLVFFLALTYGVLREQVLFAAPRQPEELRYGKRAFFEYVPGTVAFLPGIKHIEDAREFVTFRLLPESGSYVIPKSDIYWFVINHRIPARAGEATYLGVEVISFLDDAIRKLDKPVSMYRNEGWFRPQDPSYSRENKRTIGRRITLKKFFNSHVEANSLVELDHKLKHAWHGNYDVGQATS